MNGIWSIKRTGTKKARKPHAVKQQAMRFVIALRRATMILKINGRSLHYDQLENELTIEIDCKPLSVQHQEMLEFLFPDVLSAAHLLLAKQALLSSVKQ
jgi:hypothetical protein